MGLVLIGMSVAVILAFPVAGQLIVKHGSARMVVAGCSTRSRSTS